jgi:thiamine phosphate synthase YjbQ (UPF0047 family)
MKRHSLITESVKTTERCQMVDVTSRVRQAVKSAGIDDGMAIVYVPHTTRCVAKLPPSTAGSQAKVWAVF